MVKGIQKSGLSAAVVLLAGLALSAASSAHAAQFGVRVLDELGDPVPGASVCVGLEGNYSQFAASFTDLDGRVTMVDVPNVPLVVTVSRTRFEGVRLMQPALGYNLVRDVTLMSGRPGPRCRADSSLVGLPNPPAIHVRDVQVDRDDNATILQASFVGDADDYRVGADPDFFGAWSPLAETRQTGEAVSLNGRNETPRRSTIRLNSLAEDTASIFLQLRKTDGVEQNWLEARSEVIEISLPPR